MQSFSSRIWTRVAVSISYDDNHYTTDTSNDSNYFRYIDDILPSGHGIITQQQISDRLINISFTLNLTYELETNNTFYHSWLSLSLVHIEGRPDR